MSIARVALHDAEFDELRELINARSGITIKGAHRLALETSLGGRLRELRLESFHHYLQLLTTGPYQTDEFEALLEHTHVFERCIFRHARQLADVQAHHLAPLIDARSAERRLRVWCPGCAAGEEAYTIAILVLEALGDRAPDWGIEILATDAGDRALEHARAGVFAPASFPAMDVRIKRRYFVPDGRGLRAAPELRSLLSFRRHTLTDTLSALRFGTWDVIFFRDLISWLEPEARASLLALFEDRLAPDGRLVLGPDEGVRGAGVGFASVAPRPRGVFGKAPAGRPE